MINNLKNDIDLVIFESQPEGVSLEDYKIKLLNGELTLSEDQTNKILFISNKLNEYGKFLAQKNNIAIDVNDDNATIALGGLYAPEDNLDDKFSKFNPKNRDNIYSKIDGGDLLVCAAVAIGADALWALGGSSVSTWSVAAMTKAFSAVAKRFLGPIGVAIAVISFGICLSQSTS
ncbi:hypothetical protein MWU65_07830 [Cellulophaga sp. F20128]|uniref:hypothetical protein n=1 Tax=Cellulophaga sp. F20128 TaxID=2926413 RepID=UPI001FF43D7C|nr:hypothetical protein [Cellulophaga sp. F20128]MCK0157082.1 hypothetical protein [Cellulophaga sp. F20128]